MTCFSNTTGNLKKLRETFEANHTSLEEDYEKQIDGLKVDLELKRKCEIHEIEERRNQHINDLLYNHQEAFGQIKAYYNGKEGAGSSAGWVWQSQLCVAGICRATVFLAFGVFCR